MMEQLARPLRCNGAILCFHSITAPDLPSAGLANVPLELFTECIRVTMEHGRVVPLEELTRRHAAGRSTKGLVAITFDDAYAAVATHALDFIVREELPVTLFVTTRAAADGRPFWWDRVDDLFPRVSPERWRELENALGLPEQFRTGQPAEFGPLRPLRQWVLFRHAGRCPPQLDALLGELEADHGFATLHRPMTFDELDRLARLPFVALGVHTESHPVLPLLDDGEIAQEIRGCAAALEERFGRQPAALAAPFGLYDARTLRVARNAGMKAVLSVSGRTLDDSRPRDVLPRFVLTAREKLWKLRARLLGLAEAYDRWRNRSEPEYPALPSATT